MSRAAAALPPASALAHAARLLEAQGFSVVARNDRGDSLYLAQVDGRATLRLSNHARRPRQRRTYPEVAASLVICAPRSSAQIEALVAAVLRDFFSRMDRNEGAFGEWRDGSGTTE